MVVPIKWFALVLALSPLAAMAQSTAPSGRHGDGHAVNHDWYKDLKQPDIGSLCFNGSGDGREGGFRPGPSFPGDAGLVRSLDGEGGHGGAQGYVIHTALHRPEPS